MKKFLLLIGMLLPSVAFAQGVISVGIPNCDFVSGIFGAKCVPYFIAHVIKFLFGGIGGIFIISTIFAGYQYLLGAAIGQKEQGRERLKWSIIGFIASALAFYIIDFAIGAIAGT